MTKILNFNEFNSVSEKLNIQPVSKGRLNSVSLSAKEDEDKWLKKSEFNHNTAEYADFITDAYAKIQKNIERNQYGIEIKTVTAGSSTSLIVRIYGTIGFYKKLEYSTEFYVAYMGLYTTSETIPSINIGENHKLFMGDSMFGIIKKVFNEKNLKPINELVCDEKGMFNDRIKSELDKTYNQNSTWKTYYKDEIINGIKNEINDANVILKMTRNGNKISPVSLFIGINDKKIENHSSNAFRFDLYSGKIDGVAKPLMYLSPFDKSGNNTYKPSLKYMAMRSAEDLLKECGGKPWRKVAYKTPQDIISKTLKFVKECLPLMNLYCGGDVLHGTELKGVLDISIADAAAMSNI